MTTNSIYLGTSLRGRSESEEARGQAVIAEITSHCERLGYRVHNEAIKAGVNAESTEIEIPAKYLRKAKARVNSIKAWREGNAEQVQRDIAMRDWALDLIKNSVGCIWYVNRSWLGGGVEIAEALALKRPCLILNDYGKPLSSLITGYTSTRLLCVASVNDMAGAIDVLSDWLPRAEGGRDYQIRAHVSRKYYDMLHYNEKYGFASPSEMIVAALQAYSEKLK